VHLGHSAVLDVLETKVVEIDDQIVQQSAVANRHSEKLCTIERCSTTHFNQSQAMHQGTQHEVRKVAGSVEELANMSAGQFNAVIGLLQQIQYVQSTHINSQGGRSDHSHSTLARTVRTSKQKQYDTLGDTSDSENTEVSESINRLYRLAKNKGATIHSMEAQTIIGDLEKVLEIASRDIDLRIQSGHGKRKREHAGFDSEWDVHHLKRTRGLLVSASAISVNQNGELFCEIVLLLLMIP